MRFRLVFLLAAAVAGGPVVRAEPPAAERDPAVEELVRTGARAFAEADWKEARRCFQALLERDPGNPKLLANLGTVAFQEGAYEEAARHLDEAVRRDPGLSRAWETLGMAHHRAGQDYLAVSALTRAVALNPREPRVHNQLAVVLRSLGWNRGAEQSLRTAVDLDDSYGEAHYNLARMYLEREPPSPELARRHYRKAMDLGLPADPEFERDLDAAREKVYRDPEE